MSARSVLCQGQWKETSESVVGWKMALSSSGEAFPSSAVRRSKRIPSWKTTCVRAREQGRSCVVVSPVTITDRTNFDNQRDEGQSSERRPKAIDQAIRLNNIDYCKCCVFEGSLEGVLVTKPEVAPDCPALPVICSYHPRLGKERHEHSAWNVSPIRPTVEANKPPAGLS